MLRGATETLARPVFPPAPPVPVTDLPPLRFIAAFVANTIAPWPLYAFDLLTSRHTIMGVDTLLLNNPDGARHVLGAARLNYRRPVAATRVVRPLAGQGLFLAEGDTWRRQRRALAPVFTPAKVSGMLTHFQAAAETMLGGLTAGRFVNLSKVFHDATLDAVLRALFSLRPGEDASAMAAMVRDFITGPGKPAMFDGLARAESDFPAAGRARRRFQEEWLARVGQVVSQRRPGSNEAAANLVDLLLAIRDPATGAGFSDEEIRDQAASMLFAGFETTSRLLFWATYLLCLDPDEQTRLRDEARAFPPDRVASVEDLENWPRLRLTLLEALRLYPPLPHISRDAVRPDSVSGHAIKPGDRVWISPWLMHRHRRLWNNPTAFQPDRFRDQASPWTTGAFMPFGGGPRICIGASFSMAEAQITLATLLSRYRIGLADDRPVLPVGGITIGPSREPAFALTRI